MSPTAATFDLPLELIATGKVRDIYALDDERLLFVTSDRISAYDVVMNEQIPDKGRVLTGMTKFWLERAAGVPNHLISMSVSDLPDEAQPFAEDLNGRFMIVRRLNMMPVEFVVRGYLVGSGWSEYKRNGTIAGMPLPEGLKEADKLPEPLFTPATKAVTGHDENISEDAAGEILGEARMAEARDLAIELYKSGADYAAGRGIILADTKFEFGVDPEGKVVLADEVLTPDSSRFWPAEEWKPGTNPPSFDKQYLRDWLSGLDWNKEPPPPALPADVVSGTRSRYLEAYEKITGQSFDDYLKEVGS
ncbi:MAG TPA: phosphoribosylaminoimidazolesuccinocarboxamide synthase [Actinomycetota bacterium]|jgi:phosphoribosylaminoimidazole-succinocarboxamide synthase|nr:phosphoribosylaminoimidazolesuccinocarboxamide synthase [Actinomycetota bacterium]